MIIFLFFLKREKTLNAKYDKCFRQNILFKFIICTTNFIYLHIFILLYPTKMINLNRAQFLHLYRNKVNEEVRCACLINAMYIEFYIISR